MANLSGQRVLTSVRAAVQFARSNLHSFGKTALQAAEFSLHVLDKRITSKLPAMIPGLPPKGLNQSIRIHPFWNALDNQHAQTAKLYDHSAFLSLPTQNGIGSWGFHLR